MGEGLTGLTLEQLEFEPRLENLAEKQRSLLSPDDIEWMETSLDCANFMSSTATTSPTPCSVLAAAHTGRKYDVAFVQRFLVIAAYLTGSLASGWSRPSCVAQELALRCLLDQVEVIQDSYDLDLAADWRGILEDQLFEDMDSDWERRLVPAISAAAPERTQPGMMHLMHHAAFSFT